MRILAIRGCNLASLAGEFEIDLAKGPIGAAGVFAIVGNTGAGKSTLLDALCVALFDRTPRLTNHSRVQVGRGADDPLALGAQDVRTLLRRGAAAGYAEVDFEAGDARRYRARWSVRRARGQADGALQAQQVELTALDVDDGHKPERLGGTKTETLAAIHARLGLSFDQFRRSALLAQGDFAAFLRADGKDRSELLERMTGTEIYSRLSVQAHIRATLAEQRLSTGRTAALAIPVLDDGARAQAEADLVLADTAKRAARARAESAHAAARWLTEAAMRADGVRVAQLAHADAQLAVERAEPERAELALRQRAEALRGPWETVMRSERQLTVAREEATKLALAAQRATHARAEIAATHAELGELHAPIRAARIAAGLVERAGARATDATSATALGRATASDAAWLQQRAGLATEISAWSDLDAKFAQHAVAADAIAGHARSLAEQAETRSKLVRTRKAALEEARTQTDRHADAQRKADAFSKRRGLTLEAARRQEDETRRRKTDVEALCAIAAGARQARTSRDEIDRQLAELAAATSADREAVRQHETAKLTASILRTERERVVTDLRKAAGYEHARAELVDGEACPLCGAEEHPWHDRGALDEVIVAADAHLAIAVGQYDAAVTALATLAARAGQHAREHARLVKQHATAVASADAAVPTWAAQLAALGELSLVRDPSSSEAEQLGGELHAAAIKGLEAARATRSQTEAATKAAADAQADVVLCQTALDQSTARVAELDRKLADVDAAIGRIEGERAGRIDRHAELSRELAGTIIRWRAAMPALAGSGPTSVAVPKPRKASGSRPTVRAMSELAVVGESFTAPDHLVDGDAVPVLRDPAALAALAIDARELVTSRGWMSELAIEWRMRAESIAHAEAVLAATCAATDAAAREIERTVAEHLARGAVAESTRAELAAAHAAAVADLAAARGDSGFTDDDLRRLLAADASRTAALIDQLARLERAVANARSIVAERERLCVEHAATRPTTLVDTAAIGPSELAHLAALATQADDHAARLGAMLAADSDARTRRAAALLLIATAEGEAEVDRVLGEVIGSHDGKLFRSFAQSLTLDGLLAVANSHLEELAPRYQLERVPRHDLELQVIDRDLGNEVRSVQSLSGGESFLVSLALALGLSSMSAHDVRVRTLLIDEGFGTLDPTTLEMALSVLEALRQQGRQVGVISHVPQLVERVGAHVRVIARGGGRSEVIVS